MGRTPEPTKLKMVKGVRADRINQDEPEPRPPADLSAPDEVPADMVPLWDRLAPDMATKGVLTNWDREALTAYCIARHHEYANARDLEEHGAVMTKVQRELPNGDLLYHTVRNPAFQAWREAATLAHNLGTSLGLNPAARSKISVRDEKPKAKGAERLLS